MERSRKPKPIFEEALNRSPEARARYLDEACAGDELLRAEVQALLAADEHGSTFLATPELTLPEMESGPPPGTKIGRYVLGERLGQGGFGIVFRAEQEEPIRRTVALKIIRPGMDSQAVIARFQAERQALALMDHPSIARILDAGSTESGQPFFVMDLVQGEPITSYCTSHGLPAHERLALFRRVCEAVEHAHQRGILHRDLKPSNVLVTEREEGATPIVIDFGIAKAIGGARLAENTLQTTATIVGTPLYMSPEQADLGGLDVDTRSDVYSLGIILYELLAGVPPFDPAWLQSLGLREMLRVLAEVEPPTPSTRASSQAPPSETPHRSPRGSTKGELDWIVMKAIEKERTRRYGSAAEFARDIGRHLKHEPVDARPHSLAYVMSKVLRRHRLAVSLVAFAALVLISATIVSLRFAWSESEERQRAERATVQAVKEATKAERIARFSNGLFEGITPEVAGELDTKLLRLVLDRATQNIEERLRDEPEVQAAMLHTVGRVYLSIGDAPSAERHLEPALALRERELPRLHPDLLSSRQAMAELDLERGRAEKAEQDLRHLLLDRTQVLGEEDRDTLLTKDQLGLTLLKLSRLEEASAIFQEVVDQCRELGTAYDLERSASLTNLAVALRQNGDLEGAEARAREALDLKRALLGPRHPDLLISIHNQGVLLSSAGKRAEAEAFYREALEGRRAVLGEDHPRTLLTASSLAILLARLERQEEGETLARETYRIASSRWGPRDEATLVAQRSVAENLIGRATPEANAFLESYLKTSLEARGPDHMETARARSQLAVHYRRTGRPDEAEPILRDLLRQQSAELGEDDREVLRTTQNLATAIMAQGADRLGEAEKMFRSVLEARRRVLGDEHPDTLNTLGHLASCLERQGRLEEANSSDEELLELQKRRAGGTHDLSCYATIGRMGLRATKLGQLDAAETFYLECHAGFERLAGPGDRRTRAYANDLALVYERMHAERPKGGYGERAREWKEKAKKKESEPSAAEAGKGS